MADLTVAAGNLHICGIRQEGQVHPTKVERKGKRDTSDWIIVPWHDSGEVSLEGLEEELENLQGQQMIANILGQDSQLHEYAHDVEEKLRQVELESIQMSHCLLKFMWSLAAGWHEREWQPGIFAFKSMGVWYRSDSYGGFTQWFPDLGSIWEQGRMQQGQAMHSLLDLRRWSHWWRTLQLDGRVQ